MKSMVIAVIALLAFGCATSSKEIMRWEVKCFTENGVVTIVDTLEGGRIYENDGSIIHKPMNTEFYGSNGIYTGNCRSKMLKSEHTETIYQ